MFEDEQKKQMEAVRQVQDEELALFIKKNHQYKGAFFKSNLLAAIHDCNRKFGRIQQYALTGEWEGESLRDTLIDMANYATMTVALIDMGLGNNLEAKEVPRCFICHKIGDNLISAQGVGFSHHQACLRNLKFLLNNVPW